ncbi:Metacaspase-1 [Psilocybe cubensis]|uniref:Peptidase C14 caspase domain-containing protein n=2 Tax=Psilocybe cubensis TaxID=181762 RepID=A0A8H8CKB7_PSICU|nr:Metacaspase-1 [Psilocybe cubensis]KAH9478591.1 Metacaspase-1 [Psilocybe cubensis]
MSTAPSYYVPLEDPDLQQTLSPSSDTVPLVSQTARTAKVFRKLRLYLRTLARFRHRDKEKIAFLIGIGYLRGDGRYELTGSHKDIHLLEDLLRNDFNYTKFIILSDRQGTPTELLPTHDNIMRELKNCMTDNSNADFFFAYSGHSFHRDDFAGVEEDGQEECTDFPLSTERRSWKNYLNHGWTITDINHERIITDKTLREHLVNCLPKHSRLTALFDTCHSGTLLSRPHLGKFIYETFLKVILQTLSINVAITLVDGGALFRMDFEKQKNRVKQRVKTSRLLLIAAKKNHSRSKDIASRSPKKPKEAKMTKCNGFCRRVRGRRCQVISISACDDSQQSVEGPDGGTMTTAIVALLKENRTPTYAQIMEAARSAIYEAQKSQKAKMDDFINKTKCHELSCSLRGHSRCLAPHQRKREMCKVISDPKLSSLVPLHTDEILKL